MSESYCGLSPRMAEHWCREAVRVLLLRGPMRMRDLAAILDRSEKYISECLASPLGPGNRWFKRVPIQREGPGPRAHMIHVTGAALEEARP